MHYALCTVYMPLIINDAIEDNWKLAKTREIQHWLDF